MIDVYLYGMISPSIVHLLREDFEFPKPNDYAEIARTLPSIGGEAANAAIVLSKFGVTTKLDGNWVHPRHERQVFGLLGGFGIDLSRLTITERGGTEEVVIADRTSRTVFGNYAAFHTGAPQWNEARAEDIEAARMVCLDPYFRDSSERAAQLCVERCRPYVTVDCRHDSTIARHAAAIVVSHELRNQHYAGRDFDDVFRCFQDSCEGLVIFTFGKDELWYARRGGSRSTFRPFAIEPVDTTGAGDSFRAAIAYGLLRGWSDDETVEFASAVAANVCLSYPHTLNAPGFEAIREFLTAQRASRGCTPVGR